MHGKLMEIEIAQTIYLRRDLATRRRCRAIGRGKRVVSQAASRECGEFVCGRVRKVPKAGRTSLVKTANSNRRKKSG